MTDDLIEAVALTIKAEMGKQMNAQPIHPDPEVNDWAATGGEINLTAIAASVCGLFTDRIEALTAEKEAVRMEERAAIVAWMMREEKEYPSTEYSGFVAMIREEIEAGEHLK